MGESESSRSIKKNILLYNVSTKTYVMNFVINHGDLNISNQNMHRTPGAQSKAMVSLKQKIEYIYVMPNIRKKADFGGVKRSTPYP